jgi:uncharacterized protein YkwD
MFRSSWKRIATLLAATALALPAFAAPPDGGQSRRPRTETYVVPMPPLTEITRASVLAAMNVRRVAQGLPPLRDDNRLDEVAEDRMKDMEELGYWAHVAPDGRQPFMWYGLRHYRYHYAGENLATGFETTEVLVDSWMESPGHRANILSVNYEDAGIAIIDGSTKGRGSGKSIVVVFGAELGGHE